MGTRSAVLSLLLVTLSARIAGAAEPRIGRDPRYDGCVIAWINGDHELADKLTVPNVDKNPKIELFRAVITQFKSGFAAAKVTYERQATAVPATDVSDCAAIILALEARSDVEHHIDLLKKLVTRNPGDVLYLWVLASQQTKHAKYQESLDNCWKLAEIMSDKSSMLHHIWATNLDGLGRHEEALTHRRKCVARNPDAWSIAALGFTLTRLGKFDEANAAYAKATPINPNKRNWLDWGLSRYAAGNFEEALTKIDQAIIRDPAMLAAHQWRARTLEAMERWDDSLKEYEFARDLAPNDPYAYDRAAAMLKTLGRDVDSQALVQTWRDTGSADPLPFERTAE